MHDYGDMDPEVYPECKPYPCQWRDSGREHRWIEIRAVRAGTASAGRWWRGCHCLSPAVSQLYHLNTSPSVQFSSVQGDNLRSPDSNSKAIMNMPAVAIRSAKQFRFQMATERGWQCCWQRLDVQGQSQGQGLKNCPRGHLKAKNEGQGQPELRDDESRTGVVSEFQAAIPKTEKLCDPYHHHHHQQCNVTNSYLRYHHTVQSGNFIRT